MLERLARRLEIRTAEIRGEDSYPDDRRNEEGEAEAVGVADDEPTDSPAAASDNPNGAPVPSSDGAEALASPPTDHTPAWGRLAELSARVDGTLQPLTEAPPADGVDASSAGMVDAVEVDVVEVGVVIDEQNGDLGRADDDLFTPHGDLGTLSLYDAIRLTDDEPVGDEQAIQLPLGFDDETATREASDDASDEDVIPDSTPAVGTTIEGPGSNTEMVLSQAAERVTSPSVDDDLTESASEGEDRAAADIDMFDLVVTDRGTDEDDSEAEQSAAAHSDRILASAGPYHDPTFPPRPAAPDASFAEPDESAGGDAVRHGPLWYRKRIEQFGIVMGLVPMVILGVAAALVLAIRAGSVAGQVGLLLGTSAAPGLLIAGAPFGSSASYPYAAVGSIPLWLLLGWIARRRTLRMPVADWRDYALQLTWLTLAVVAGAAAALTIAAIRLGGPLLG